MIMTTAACEIGGAVAQDKSADSSQFLRQILQRKIQDSLAAPEAEIFIANSVVRNEHGTDVVASFEKGFNTDGPKCCAEKIASKLDANCRRVSASEDEMDEDVHNAQHRNCADDRDVSKKKRIEGIVSSMHDMSYATVGGCKKRKHYQPVQHETTRPIREEKKRAVDEEDFKCQLKMMEEKLLEMRQRYDQICNHDNVGNAQNQGEAVPVEKEKPASCARRQNGMKSALHSHFNHNGTIVIPESQLLNAANKAIARKKDFLQCRLDSAGQNHFGADFEDMTEALKADMISSLASMIDSILDRYLCLLKNVGRFPARKECTTKEVRTARSYESFIGKRDSSENFVESNCFGSSRAKSPQLSPKSYNARSSFELWDSYDTESNHEGTVPDAESDSEQCEALSLVMTPKKRRTKVTDSRIIQRMGNDSYRPSHCSYHHGRFASNYSVHPEGRSRYVSTSSLLSANLSTSVAITNPNLNHSDVFARYSICGSNRYAESFNSSKEDLKNMSSFHHPLLSTQSSPDGIQSVMKNDATEQESSESHCENTSQTLMTLTPMHLRKAKLMFFWVRYPSSSILKTYFPDVKFNKNNTAQLVKWFSNFREFYYIQIEKFARQAVSENLDNIDDLKISLDSDLFRVLNLHYNRNNHIEIPSHFCPVMEQTVKEFYHAIVAGKDQEPSWKKSIYKVIARLDETVPEYFKSPSFLEQLE